MSFRRIVGSLRLTCRSARRAGRAPMRGPAFIRATRTALARRASLRGVQTGLVVALSAVALAACGGGGTDRGGFTSGDRKAAENVLALLAQTAVYTAAAKTSYTQGFPPTAWVGYN